MCIACNSDYNPPAVGETTGGEFEYTTSGDLETGTNETVEPIRCFHPGSQAINNEMTLYGCQGSWNFGYFFAYAGNGLDWNFDDDMQGTIGFSTLFCSEPPEEDANANCRLLLQDADLAPDTDLTNNTVMARACCTGISSSNSEGSSQIDNSVTYDACTFDFVTNVCRAFPLKIDSFINNLSISEKIVIMGIDDGDLWTQLNVFNGYLHTQDAQDECLTDISPSLRHGDQGDWKVGNRKLPNLEFDPSVDWPLLAEPRFSIHVESIGGTYTPYAIDSWSQIAASCAAQQQGFLPPIPSDISEFQGSVVGGSIDLDTLLGDQHTEISGGSFSLRTTSCPGNSCFAAIDILHLSTTPFSLGVVDFFDVEGSLQRPTQAYILNGATIFISDGDLSITATARIEVFGLTLFGNEKVPFVLQNSGTTIATLDDDIFRIDSSILLLPGGSGLLTLDPSPCN